MKPTILPIIVAPFINALPLLGGNDIIQDVESAQHGTGLAGTDVFNVTTWCDNNMTDQQSCLALAKDCFFELNQALTTQVIPSVLFGQCLDHKVAARRRPTMASHSHTSGQLLDAVSFTREQDKFCDEVPLDLAVCHVLASSCYGHLNAMHEHKAIIVTEFQDCLDKTRDIDEVNDAQSNGTSTVS